MYKCLLELDTSGIYSSPWIAYVKSICNDCGMSGAWLTQSVNNPNSFKKAIEIRLKDQWITTWNTNLIMKNICNSYRMYKVVYVMEEYLVKLSMKNRIMLSKLRACNNKLPIIEGRYRNISRAE